MALTANPPINLTDIQNEFGANSLVSASNAAGLSLPTGMLEFLGLSSSVTLTIAPSFFVGTATIGDEDGWENTNSLIGKTAFTTSTFANSPTVNPQAKVRSIEAGFTTSSVGWAPIPSNAIINDFRFEVITAGCCLASGSVVRFQVGNFWLGDADPLMGLGPDGITDLGSTSTIFFSQNDGFTPIFNGTGNIPVSNINFRERTPKQTQQQMFIDSWNNGLFRLSISGASSTTGPPFFTPISQFGDPFLKRDDNPNFNLRIYRVLCFLNYSLG